MLKQFFSSAADYIFPIGVADVIDIAIIAYIIYKVLMFIRGKSAARVGQGVVVLLLLWWVSDLVGLNVVNLIISKTISLGLLALVVLFQPEIRRALEKFGGAGLNKLLSRSNEATQVSRIIEQTVEACADLSWSRYGALIVFERENRLDEYLRTGTVIDAEVSSELLKNIFFPKAALHDGACIIRNGRIAAAGCILPLTNRTNISKDLGMRHRAGIGMSESGDSVVIIVSEERGSISVAVDAMIKTNLSKDTLRALLTGCLVEDEDRKKTGDAIFNVFKGKRNGKKDNQQ